MAILRAPRSKPLSNAKEVGNELKEGKVEREGENAFQIEFTKPQLQRSLKPPALIWALELAPIRCADAPLVESISKLQLTENNKFCKQKLENRVSVAESLRHITELMEEKMQC